MVARKIKGVPFVYNLVLKLTFLEIELCLHKECNLLYFVLETWDITAHLISGVARVSGARGQT